MKAGYFYCDKCGKKLVQRLDNGLYRFIFGGRRDGSRPKVEILIFGNFKMKCTRDSCVKKFPDYWSVFNFFPPVDKVNTNQEPPGVIPADKLKNKKEE